MRKHLFIICLFLICKISIIHGLNAQHYSFKSYNIEEGLPQSEVWDMISDRRGYLWLATNGGGLARFNGRQFHVFSKKHGLVDDQPVRLFEDSKGNIWIATIRGVSMYDGKKFHNYTDNFLNVVFPQWAEDSQGRVWLYQNQNAQNLRLVCFDKGKVQDITKLYPDIFSPTSPPINLFKDKKGIIYVLVGGKGLYQFENNTWKPAIWAQHDTLKKKWAITPLCHDRQDRYWFTALNPQEQNPTIDLAYSQKGKFFKLALPAIFATNNIAQMHEDLEGNVWITHLNAGVICVKADGQMIHYNQDNGLVSNFLNGAACDKEGNMWFASRGSGIIRFDKGKFIAFTEKDGLGRNVVRAFLEDKTGKYWITTAGGGIATYDGKKLRSYFSKDATLGRIKVVDTTDAGKVLLGCDGGFLQIEGEEGNYSYTKINERYGLPAAAGVSWLHKTKIKGVPHWIFGTFNLGIFVCNLQEPTKTVNYQSNNSPDFPTNYVHFITEDRQGRFWICTNTGLICFKDGKLRRYSRKEGLLNELVMQVCEDKNGNFWVATYGEGLAYFDGKAFTYYNPQNSAISASVVYSIMYDNEGNLWAGTQKGVDKITFDANGKITKIRNYDQYDGFTGLECNGVANYKDRQGNLWFGTIKGALRYNPKEDKPNQAPPVLNITGIRLFFREVEWGNETYRKMHAGLSEWFGLPKNLVLTSDKHHVTFDFEAISFQASEKVRYSWRLEGIDEEWSPETEKTEAIYSNLSAGTYTFWVKAMNNEGVWSASVSYQLTVLPPWYLTWWAISFFVLLVAGSIILAVRWRIEALKKYQKHLEKLVAEKTSEVTERNTELQQQKEEITIQAEHLLEANEEITKRQQEITDSINYAKRIQDAILPQVQHIQELLPESFILFRPRDIVSGDFYWFAEIQPFRNKGFRLQTAPDRQDFELLHDLTKSKGKVIMAAADCTGHGVPGAFMSMIGNELLHEIVTEKGITSPEQILYALHTRVRQALKQDETTNRDGMDISICLIDRDRQVLEYAGARSRMLYFQNGEMFELKGDKSPIGGEQRELERMFTLQTVSLVASEAVLAGKENLETEIEMEVLPTTLYMFSDGYIDQFGGKGRKKFRISQLRDILRANQEKDMPTQKHILEETLDAWTLEANEAQIDDIMVIGVRL